MQRNCLYLIQKGMRQVILSLLGLCTFSLSLTYSCLGLRFNRFGVYFFYFFLFFLFSGPRNHRIYSLLVLEDVAPQSSSPQTAAGTQSVKHQTLSCGLVSPAAPHTLGCRAAQTCWCHDSLLLKNRKGRNGP